MAANKVLLAKTGYNEGFIIEAELQDAIKWIDKFHLVRVTDDYISLKDKDIQYMIIDKPMSKELD